jgi:hypothetical protein
MKPKPMEKTMTNESNNKPVAKINFGRVRGSIWANKTEEGKTFYTMTADSFYTDKNGNLKNTTSFSLSELLLLSKVADQAHTWISEQSQEGSPDENAS